MKTAWPLFKIDHYTYMSGFGLYGFALDHRIATIVLFFVICAAFFWRDFHSLLQLERDEILEYLLRYYIRTFVLAIPTGIYNWIFHHGWVDDVRGGAVVMWLTLIPHFISGILVVLLAILIFTAASILRFISHFFPRLEHKVSHYHINASQSILNIDSDLRNVSQSIQAAPSIGADAKEELLSLFEQLKTELSKVPGSHAREGEVVSATAKQLGDELSKSSPIKQVLKFNAGNLIEATKALEGVLPIALSIAQKISEFISKTFS